MSKLISDRFRGADYVRQLMRATPEVGTPIEEVLKPEYWAHVAQKAKVGDIIEILPEDGAWFVQALVVACSKIHLKLHVISKTVINEAKAEKKDDKKDEPFRIEFKGPQRKWAIIRSKDATYVKDGFDDRAAADKWLEDNQKDLM